MLKFITVIGVTGTALANNCDPCQITSKATCIANGPCAELVTSRFMQKGATAGKSNSAAAAKALEAGLPMIWDASPPDGDDSSGASPDAPAGKALINPFNSIRPEYRDEPPPHKVLQKLWLHHLSDHVYKTPFVRNMKSGLWEAGVPNIYASGGYNRRKFKTEEECLKFVRLKTGSGLDLAYGEKHAARQEAPKEHQDQEDPDGEQQEGFRAKNEYFTSPAI